MHLQTPNPSEPIAMYPSLPKTMMGWVQKCRANKIEPSQSSQGSRLHPRPRHGPHWRDHQPQPDPEPAELKALITARTVNHIAVAAQWVLI